MIASDVRLRSDVSEWLEGGSFKGEMREVVWDEEGDSLKLPTRPATWTPPDQASSTHRCCAFHELWKDDRDPC